MSNIGGGGPSRTKGGSVRIGGPANIGGRAPPILGGGGLPLVGGGPSGGYSGGPGLRGGPSCMKLGISRTGGVSPRRGAAPLSDGGPLLIGGGRNIFGGGPSPKSILREGCDGGRSEKPWLGGQSGPRMSSWMLPVALLLPLKGRSLGVGDMSRGKGPFRIGTGLLLSKGSKKSELKRVLFYKKRTGDGASYNPQYNLRVKRTKN